MADFNVNSLTSNPLDGGSSMGGNIIGSNSNTFDDGISYQGSSSSSDLGQSPFGRLSEVTDLNTIFNGVGSGGENPFANNPLGAQVLFGGDNQGGSPFSNLRSNIDKLVSSSTNGANPTGGSGSTNPFAGGGISAQSADGDSTSGITGGFGGSFSGGIGGSTTGDTSSIDLSGAFGGATSEIEIRSYIDTLVNSKLSEGGISPSFNVPGSEFGGGSIPSTDSFGTVSDETFSAIFGIPTAGSFDLDSYGIPEANNFVGSIGGSGGAIPIEGGGIGGPADGGGIPNFGAVGGGGISSFGSGNPFA